jgi:crotonobetainyl-CoA:carnitine CoA-transferase CaiB-like acyl-CoA transferase
VLQGFRAGVADRLGVGAADLHKVNPELMYLHASGYGPHPPDGHRPSFAPSIGAAAGVARTNLGDTVPERPGLTLDEIRLGSRLLAGASTQMTAQADGIAAVGVASSLLLAALAQARGAGGQAMVSSMLATATHALAGEVVDFEGAVHPAKPDPDVRGTSARYRIYDASDGYVFLAAPQEHEWPRLVAALAPWVDLADARFAAETDRLGHDDELAAVLAATFLTRSKDDWERDLLATGVGCVAVTTAPIESVLQGDDFGTAHGFVVEVDHPTFGRHPRLAPLMRFSRSATQAKAGQLAGDATDALLGELGYRPDEIEDLRSRQIVA